ncbi:hypothetical protein NQ315_001807 [Exocentrus adspersus]|uniref:Uncharacterized protein n=1 Tax=Exocentrus adspersus TaxID=1586481 RepID=A0AAV8W9K2_9CUCU|nr:hypothetical protein NQ315_001807 [Exocentrus adspersus]
MVSIIKLLCHVVVIFRLKFRCRGLRSASGWFRLRVGFELFRIQTQFVSKRVAKFANTINLLGCAGPDSLDRAYQDISHGKGPRICTYINDPIIHPKYQLYNPLFILLSCTQSCSLQRCISAVEKSPGVENSTKYSEMLHPPSAINFNNKNEIMADMTRVYASKEKDIITKPRPIINLNQLE